MSTTSTSNSGRHGSLLVPPASNAAAEQFANRIVCKDAITAMQSLPDGCLDLEVTSPPYFGCRKYGTETLGREEHPDDYIDDLFQITKAMYRVLSPTGSLYLNIGDVYYGTKGFHRNKGTWTGVY
jgi:site-specific DNA-methyltransferase (adenine-specific)